MKQNHKRVKKIDLSCKELQIIKMQDMISSLTFSKLNSKTLARLKKMQEREQNTRNLFQFDGKKVVPVEYRISNGVMPKVERVTPLENIICNYK